MGMCIPLMDESCAAAAFRKRMLAATAQAMGFIDTKKLVLSGKQTHLSVERYMNKHYEERIRTDLWDWIEEAGP
jgi:hypothetical protein